jgi:hypothetical protein
MHPLIATWVVEVSPTVYLSQATKAKKMAGDPIVQNSYHYVDQESQQIHR